MTVPVIDTPNLRLRGPQLADFKPLCAYFADPRSRFNGGPMEPADVWRVLMAGAGQWQLRGRGIWNVTLRDSDDFIGFAGIFEPFDWPEPELGYGIAAGHEGKGLAFEAAMAARQAAATHFGLPRLPSYVAPDNARSIALARRMGAQYEGDITLRGKAAQVLRHPQVTP